MIVTAEQRELRDLPLIVCLECGAAVIAALKRWRLPAGLYEYLTTAIILCRIVHFVVIRLMADIVGCDSRVEHTLQSGVIIFDELFTGNEPLSIHSHPSL